MGSGVTLLNAVLSVGFLPGTKRKVSKVNFRAVCPKLKNLRTNLSKRTLGSVVFAAEAVACRPPRLPDGDQCSNVLHLEQRISNVHNRHQQTTENHQNQKMGSKVRQSGIRYSTEPVIGD